MRHREVRALQDQVARIGREAEDARPGAAGGTNASTLQGHPAADFALVGHDHDAAYAPLEVPEVSALPDAGDWLGRFIRLRAGSGQPTLVYLAVTNSPGGAEWLPFGQST